MGYTCFYPCTNLRFYGSLRLDTTPWEILSTVLVYTQETAKTLATSKGSIDTIVC